MKAGEKIKMKRIAAGLLAAVVCLSFTSCLDTLHGAYEIGKGVVEESERHAGYMESQKEEMAALVENYSPVFKEKAAEIYGSDAALTDIRCVENYPEHKNDGAADYAEALLGTLTVDGKQYEALYYCHEGIKTERFRDTVHTDDICSEPLNALPLDKSLIVEAVYPMTDSFDDYGKMLKFDWHIKNFDEWVSFDESSFNPMKIYIFTTQDVSTIPESEIRSAPAMRKLAKATSFAQITIMSLKDTEKLAELKERLRINTFAVSHLETPVAEYEASAKFCDEFHMTGAMVIENSFSDFESEKDEERELDIKVIK